MPKKGYKMTNEHRLKIKEKRKFQIFTLETRKKMSLNRLGKSLSLQTRKKMSLAQTGIKRPYAKPPHFFGEKSSHWKGNNVGYYGLHHWIRKTFGSAKKCENKKCKYPRKNAAGNTIKEPKRYEWALKKGKKYTRNKKDYFQLCPSCHRKYDA